MDRLRNSLSSPLWRGDLQDDATVATRLLEILHNRRGLGVSDPHDMIYGHLGILGNIRPERKVDRFFQVDYKQPIPELFTQVVLFIISARGDFDILSQVEERSIEKRTTLPTWVPDWTLPSVSISQVTLRERFTRVRETEPPVVSIGTPPVLGLIGDFEGTIESVLDSQPPTVDLEAIIDTVLQSIDLGLEEHISLVHVLLHRQLCTWFHEQGLAPLAFSSIIPRNYYQHPLTDFEDKHSAWQLRLDLWNWIEFHVHRHSSNSGLSMPTIAIGTINHDVDLVTALMLSMTDKYRTSLFPGKKIAILKDMSLLLVPSCAQVGDDVCSFCPGPGNWILRRIQPENHAHISVDLLSHFQKVQKALDANLQLELDFPDKLPNYSVREAVNDALLSTAPVEYANFIGECFPGPFSYNPWNSKYVRSPVQREGPRHNAQIVALH